jgi:hypothetical protein
MIRFGCALWPFDQQPLFGRGFAPANGRTASSVAFWARVATVLSQAARPSGWAGCSHVGQPKFADPST